MGEKYENRREEKNRVNFEHNLPRPKHSTNSEMINEPALDSTNKKAAAREKLQLSSWEKRLLPVEVPGLARVRSRRTFDVLLKNFILSVASYRHVCVISILANVL